MTTEKRIYDGNRAKEVLENEAFLAAFTDIENEVIEQWKNSPARDAEGREKLWQYRMLLQKVRTHLTTTMESGKLAQIELTRRQGVVERLRAGMTSWGE